jgi:diketogulonate reductase-like aldo/keto reductase
VEQGRILARAELQDIATRHDATPAQVALAWLLRQEGIVAIPNAGTAEHVRENRAVLDIVLGEKDLGELDRVFPPPRRKVPLQDALGGCLVLFRGRPGNMAQEWAC